VTTPARQASPPSRASRCGGRGTARPRTSRYAGLGGPPEERAVFVLREVFGFEHAEIGRRVGGT